MPAPSRGRSALALVGFLAITFAVSGLGGFVTIPSVSTVSAARGWYYTLHQPPFSPPAWVFAPVWTVLYALIAISAWLAWRTRVSTCRSGGLRMWAVQLAVNLGWTLVFFGLHAPGFALVDILILIVAIAYTIKPFLTIRPLAAWLLLPYLAWTCFAFYLNLGIVLLNR